MTVKVKSLGGLTEVGALNCYLVYWTDEDGITKAVMLDCGQKIPDEEDDDFEFNESPNFSAIPAEVDEIAAVFLSHGHLDHVGAINEFIRFYSESVRFEGKPLPRIYASPNTARVVENKERVDIEIYEELDPQYAVFGRRPNIMQEVAAGDVKNLGGAKLEFFPMLHSIPEALGCKLRVNGINVVYTGDFKLHGLTEQETAEYARVLNSDAIRDADILLIDSTGVDKEGTGESDEVVVDNLLKVIENHPNERVFITTFSSHTGRTYGLMERLRRLDVDRGIVLHGRSMRDQMEHVRLVPPLPGRWGFTPGAWKKYSYGRHNVPDDAIILLTGSQGEPRSALKRILEDHEYRMEDIHIMPRDVVVFAARTIPGNENAVAEILAELRKTDCIIYFPLDHCHEEPCMHEPSAHEPQWAREAAGPGIIFGKFHVSGHAYQEDLKDFVSAASPRKIMPIHAELERRAKMADLLPDYEVLLPHEGEEIIV